MARAPVAGRTKTRLARDIGSVAAAWWYRHQLQRLLRKLRDPRWTIVLSAQPGARHVAFGKLRPEPQCRGDIGRRMAHALARHRPALLIGSDIPGIRPDHIAAGMRALRAGRYVIGPAEDGGYWAIGVPARPLPPGLFDEVRWSGPHALDDTLANLPSNPVLLQKLRDVDCAADLLP